MPGPREKARMEKVAAVLVERFTGRGGWLVEPLGEGELEVLAVRDGPKLFPNELGTTEPAEDYGIHDRSADTLVRLEPKAESRSITLLTGSKQLESDVAKAVREWLGAHGKPEKVKVSWRQGFDPARVDEYATDERTFFVWRDVVKGSREAGTSNAYLLFVRRADDKAKLVFDRTAPHPAWPYADDD